MSKEDTQFSIGKLLGGGHGRDAVHFAVVPVIGNETLFPGTHIGFDVGGARVTATPPKPYELIGIVDPFLTSDILAGERFWMFLYPNTITGLKHVWSHPAISEDGYGVGSSSELWLRNFAKEVDADYQEMMWIAETHCGEGRYGGDYLCEGGKWEGQGTPDEFWEHFHNVTGKKPSDMSYGGPGIFSCSC